MIKSLKYVLVCLVFFFISDCLPVSDAMAQVIHGMVRDLSNKQPISGAFIEDEKTGENTISDESGSFKLSSEGAQINILVRYLGYKTIVYSITDPSSLIIIELEASNILLGEVIVTAYETNQKIREIPGSISLLSKEDLSIDNEVNIVPALNRVPGIYMHSGTYNTNRLTIRGIGARSLYSTQKIRAYFDEIPLTSGDGETTVEDIDPNLIQRIEIIKGPSSSLYGAGLGGTLLLRSNKPALGVNSFDLQTTSGSYGYMKNALDFNHTNRIINLNLSGNRIHSNGYRDNNEYDRYSFGFSGDVMLGQKTTLAFLSNYINLIAYIPSSLNREMYDNSPRSAAPNWQEAQGYEDYEKWLTGISLNHSINDYSSIDVSLFGNYRTSYERRPFNILTEKTRAVGIRTKYTLSTNFGEIPAKIVIGTEYFNDVYKWQTWERVVLEKGDLITDNLEDRSTLNAFSKIDLQVSKRSFITAGINLNHTYYNYKDQYSTDSKDDSGDYSFGTTVSPRIGYSYNLQNNLNLHASISHGFSPPTLQETLTPEGAINPDIRPETGVNYEVGIKGSLLNNRLYTDISIYALRVNDLLVARRTGEDEFIGINAGKTNHSGIEIYGSYNFLNPELKKYEFNGFLTYSLNNYKFEEFVEADNDYSGNDLTGVPRQIINTGINFNWNGIYGNITYQFVDKMPMRDDNSVYSDPYQLVNSKFGYRHKLGKAFMMELFGIANNLFNEKYASQILVNASSFGGNAPRYYYPGLPRNYYIGVKIKYNF